ncbi:hypothetical protein AMTRI_Chr03g48040 [Amborella trichopoda]
MGRVQPNPNPEPNSAQVQVLDLNPTHRVQMLDPYSNLCRLYPTGPRSSLSPLPPLPKGTRTGLGLGLGWPIAILVSLSNNLPVNIKWSISQRLSLLYIIFYVSLSYT